MRNSLTVFSFIVLGLCMLAATMQPSEEDRTRAAIHQALMAEVKTPSTVQISELTHMTGGHFWGSFDAENSFGAPIRMKYFAELKDGRVVSMRISD